MFRNSLACISALAFGVAVSSAASSQNLHDGTRDRLSGLKVTGATNDRPVDTGGQYNAEQPRFFRMDVVMARRGVTSSGVASSGNTKGSVSPRFAASSQTAGPVADFDANRPAVRVSDEPFGLFTFRAPQGLIWTKWQDVQAVSRTEDQQIAACREQSADCSDAGRKFTRLVARAKTGDLRARIAAVNLHVNLAVEYVTDYVRHGVPDRWTSALTTLQAGTGDCEDYAILKYGLLRELGIAEADLRVLLVRDRSVAMDHAVLAVRYQTRWLILDNRRAAPLEVADVPHFLPLFALHENGVNLFAAPFAANLAHESELDIEPATSALASSSTDAIMPLL